MRINLSPCRTDETITVIVSDDILIINGEVFDFTPLPEGGVLPSEAISTKWLINDVKRKNGVIELTMILPHGNNASESARFPKPLNITTSGLVELPK